MIHVQDETSLQVHPIHFDLLVYANERLNFNAL